MADLESGLTSGTMHFWPARQCMAITEFLEFSKCRVLNVFIVGGERGKSLRELLKELEPELVKFGKASGCSMVMGSGIFEAWRPVVEGIGYRHMWTVMVKDI